MEEKTSEHNKSIKKRKLPTNNLSKQMKNLFHSLVRHTQAQQYFFLHECKDNIGVCMAKNEIAAICSFFFNLYCSNAFVFILKWGLHTFFHRNQVNEENFAEKNKTKSSSNREYAKYPLFI